MPYEDNTNSFLFGLNQFTSPPADASTPRASNGRSDSMLASLEAFASDDVGGGSNVNEGMAAQAPNFADQLALWTNANFSFDGPTGHALLGDEEKEKEEAEHNRRRDDENRRHEDERERSSRNAAASSRASNALRGKARDIDHNQPESSSYPTSSQAAASPGPQLHQQGPYYPGTPAYQNARPPQSSQAGGSNPLFPFANNFSGGMTQQQQQQGISGSAPSGLGSLDMTSALALQHLLASNPLALASLSQLAGLSNPQIQNQLAGLANNGANAGMFGMQQQGQNRNNMPNAAAQWLAAQSQNASRTGSFSGPSPQSGWPAQMPNLAASPSVPPTVNGTSTRAGKSQAKEEKDTDGSGTHSVDVGASDSDSGVAAKKKRTSTSEGKKAQIGDNDDDDDILSRLEDIEKRYEIPPLSLIDTGNPEADAEANRQAIEEDKRRRNTAASARFRIKKKQREAALENAAKELHQRLADLESENERLRTENGWLKNLITVRPEQGVPGGFDQSAVPNAFSNAAAAAAAGTRASTSTGPSGPNASARSTASALSSNHPSPSLVDSTPHLPSTETPDRHTGLHPRGVGTGKGAKYDSDAPPKAAANGKRDREN